LAHADRGARVGIGRSTGGRIVGFDGHASNLGRRVVQFDAIPSHAMVQAIAERRRIGNQNSTARLRARGRASVGIKTPQRAGIAQADYATGVIGVAIVGGGADVAARATGICSVPPAHAGFSACSAIGEASACGTGGKVQAQRRTVHRASRTVVCGRRIEHLGAARHDVIAGLTIPFGVSKIMASYIRKDDRTAANRDADQLAVGYNYTLSKRTDLYVSHARISNDAALGTAGFYTVGNGSDTGSGDKAFNFGVRHTF
jgi:hypothetical protein